MVPAWSAVQNAVHRSHSFRRSGVVGWVLQSWLLWPPLLHLHRPNHDGLDAGSILCGAGFGAGRDAGALRETLALPLPPPRPPPLPRACAKSAATSAATRKIAMATILHGRRRIS